MRASAAAGICQRVGQPFLRLKCPSFPARPFGEGHDIRRAVPGLVRDRNVGRLSRLPARLVVAGVVARLERHDQMLARFRSESAIIAAAI